MLSSTPAAGRVPWQWIAGLSLPALIVSMVVGLVLAVPDRDLNLGFTVLKWHHVRLLSISAVAWSYISFVWLCCAVVRAKGYHPAWGLVGLTIVGALVLPFLPSDEPDLLGEKRTFSWAGARHLGALFAMYALVVVAFWNSFDSLWVLDNLYIIHLDPRTQATTWFDPPGANPIRSPGFCQYFFQDYWWPKGISGLYRPLTSITYWLNWTWLGNGDDPRGFHAVNLVVHWINAALVYTLAFVLTRRWALAALAGALFAIHPITTESVTNIIGRADLFAAVAVVSGVLLWRWAAELPRWHVLWGFFAVMLITAFGVFSKESAAAVTLVILVYDVTYRWSPTLAKWFGLLLLALIVPWFAAGSFRVAEFAPTVEWSRTTRLLLAGAVFAVAAAQHVVLSRRPAAAPRVISLAVTIALSVVTSLFIPASGAALILLLAAYELLLGPWLKERFPAFHEFRWPALGYTAAFVVLLVAGPLAWGLALWLGNHKLVEQKLSESVAGGLKHLHLAAAYVPTSVDFQRAGLFVGIGLLAWIWSMLRSQIGRGVVAGLFVVMAILAIVVTRQDAAFEYDPLFAAVQPSEAGTGESDLAKAVRAELATLGAEHRSAATHWIIWSAAFLAAAAVAGVLFTPGSGARRVRLPWVMLPAVLLAAAAASFYVFWAGFVLTFLVGLLELINRSAAPQKLRDSDLWRSLMQRFVVGYYLLLPPIIAFFIVRFFIFNVQSTPPEEPFLDNPLRGGPDSPIPFWQTRMTAIKVIGKLMYLLVYPRHLSSDYSHDEIPFFLAADSSLWENFKTVFALLAIVALVVLACYSFRRNKALCFFILTFFAALLPTSNLLILIGSIMAERFLYLPLVGFVGIAAILAVLAVRWALDRVRQAELPIVPARAAMCAALPALVLTLFVYRTYIRNFDWRDDIRLWESAIEVSPRSFRCYQSLAFAYYEQHAQHNIDKIIRIAEGGRPIVDPLPHDRNSSRLYLHLGMYYNIKGEMLSQKNPAVQMGLTVTPEARPWFAKAVDALERGVLVDRTFNRVNREKQIERGDPPERIFDVGLPPVYMTLGLSYMRLGMYREAFNAFQYQRQLEPDAGESYLRIAVVQLEQNLLDDAAISLIQCLLLEPPSPQGANPVVQEAWTLLSRIYGAAGETGRGAILVAPEGPRLNMQHPAVREHFIGAYRGLIRVFRWANRTHLAEQARKAAVERYRMPAAYFDSVLTEPLPRVTPHGLDYTSPPEASRAAAR